MEDETIKSCVVGGLAGIVLFGACSLFSKGEVSVVGNVNGDLVQVTQQEGRAENESSLEVSTGSIDLRYSSQERERRNRDLQDRYELPKIEKKKTFADNLHYEKDIHKLFLEEIEDAKYYPSMNYTAVIIDNEDHFYRARLSIANRDFLSSSIEVFDREGNEYEFNYKLEELFEQAENEQTRRMFERALEAVKTSRSPYPPVPR